MEKTVNITITESELKALIEHHQNMRSFFQRHMDEWKDKDAISIFQTSRNQHVDRIVELYKFIPS